MLDEAFAVFSRIDEGGTVPNQHTAPPAKNGRANLQSAARDLAASISAQLDSIIDNVTSSNACCRMPKPAHPNARGRGESAS
jgi:hypothetical protein